jgi:glycosyltransferase involved in cell wall biosynthesis
VARAFDIYWSEGGKTGLKIFGSDTSSPVAGGSVNEFIRKRYGKHIDAGLLQIPGLAPPEALAREKRQSVGLLHPSHKENFPYTVIEHMASGGIALASRSGGQAEIITNGVSGFLFEAANPEDIARAVLASEAQSTVQRAEMTRQAAQSIREACDYTNVLENKQRVLANPARSQVRFPFIRGDQQVFAPAHKTDAPRLSIVVPYFNLPDFIEETVQSALASTFHDIEVVVVDDGSTDTRSPLVLAEIGKLDRVRVLHKKNAGVAEARNFGVANARGQFVALLDADDLVQPTYYERCMNVLDAYENVGFVGCWNDDFDENGTIRHWPTFNPEPPMQYIFNTTNCQGLVMRKEAYLIGGGHDKNLRMFLDDWEATISMLAKGVRGVMIPMPLFRYRIRQGSTFRSKADLWVVNYEYIIAKHQDAYNRHAAEIISFLNANGSNMRYHNPTWQVSDPVVMAQDPYSHGRLARLVRGYYRFTSEYPSGRFVRKLLSPLTPLVNLLLAVAFRVRNTSHR